MTYAANPTLTPDPGRNKTRAQSETTAPSAPRQARTARDRSADPDHRGRRLSHTRPEDNDAATMATKTRTMAKTMTTLNEKTHRMTQTQIQTELPKAPRSGARSDAHRGTTPPGRRPTPAAREECTTTTHPKRRPPPATQTRGQRHTHPQTPSPREDTPAERCEGRRTQMNPATSRRTPRSSPQTPQTYRYPTHLIPPTTAGPQRHTEAPSQTKTHS